MQDIIDWATPKTTIPTDADDVYVVKFDYEKFKYELESLIASIGPSSTNRDDATDAVQQHPAATSPKKN